jgi:hypothetical protein
MLSLGVEVDGETLDLAPLLPTCSSATAAGSMLARSPRSTTMR